MEPSDPDTLVRRFVDDDLSDAEIKRALHRIADDPDARDLLRFEVQMTQNLAAAHRDEPSPDFASETMAALPEDTGEGSPSLAERLHALWRRLWAPVSLRVRPLPTVVTPLLVGIVAWLVWPAGLAPSTAPSGSPASPTVQPAATSSPTDDGTVWIRFLYTNSDAQSVAVAGDFNQWSPTSLTPRTVNGQTVWTGLVPVPPGEHEYQFVINGERWIPDPLAPTKQKNGFGAKNAVLKV